ncbi:MAG: hypothetical protein OXC08_20665 [Thiotrichales bacterium]|nr:hypothetical protein [Thiotrichales bacterium]
MPDHEAPPLHFNIVWHDRGREPRQPPNPEYPEGIDLDGAGGVTPACTTPLDYPAKRCGYYSVECTRCGVHVMVTTAGRPDDPRSLTIPCKAAVLCVCTGCGNQAAILYGSQWKRDYALDQI